MTIIVTRPNGDGQALCDLLNQRGIESLHHPLVAISQGADFSQAIDDLNQADIAIFVSRHAVHFLAQALQENKQTLSELMQTKPRRFFAIGEGTAKAFQQCFFPDAMTEEEIKKNIEYPDISDSEHLLSLSGFDDVTGKSICVFRANSGRALIFQTLKQKGAKIRYNAIYQRQFLSFNASKTAENWQEKHVTGIIMTSGEALTFFCDTMLDKKLTNEKTNSQTWLKTLDLFVPSQRIEAQAKQLGFINIMNTQGASNAQIVKYLDPKN